MPQSQLKILYSTVAVTVISAMLYFFGQSSIAGHANGLGLPPYILKQDLWETISSGGRILVIALLRLPDNLFGGDGFRWEFALGLIGILAVFAILYWSLRRWHYRLYVLGFCLFVGLSFHVFHVSTLASSDHMRRAEKCLIANNCVGVGTPTRVVFDISTDSTKRRVGIILRINASFMVMLTKGGLLTIPVSGIRLLESVKQK